VRLLHSTAGLCALAVVLAGCSQGTGAPEDTTLTMPASPSATPGPSSGQPSGQPGEAAPVEPGAGESTESGTTAGPSEHCVMVAGGVTTAMLAPLSLRSESDRDELQALEQQILALRDRVPPELHDDFTALAHSVEAPPEGSGTFDEKAFRHAMVPVQDWLGRHCAGS
jgi:hypothetical protein